MTIANETPEQSEYAYTGCTRETAEGIARQLNNAGEGRADEHWALQAELITGGYFRITGPEGCFVLVSTSNGPHGALRAELHLHQSVGAYVREGTRLSDGECELFDRQSRAGTYYYPVVNGKVNAKAIHQKARTWRVAREGARAREARNKVAREDTQAQKQVECETARMVREQLAKDAERLFTSLNHKFTRVNGGSESTQQYVQYNVTSQIQAKSFTVVARPGRISVELNLEAKTENARELFERLEEGGLL